MRKSIVRLVLLLLVAGFAPGAQASLDGFLRNLNIQAKTDLHSFSIRVAAQFNIPGAQVEAVIRKVDSPADAFMIFQLGQMANRPPEEVMQRYRSSKGRGWGVIAKQLGIKPGSPEFHALRRGDLAFTGKPGARYEEPASKGKAHAKGKVRGRGDD